MKLIVLLALDSSNSFAIMILCSNTKCHSRNTIESIQNLYILILSRSGRNIDWYKVLLSWITCSEASMFWEII